MNIKRSGNENVTHKPAIEERASQIEQIKAGGVCSFSSPLSLLRSVWFHIVLFFCRRRREWHKAQFFGKPIQILLTFEKRFHRQQFSFVVNLIFRLTDQFEVVCLSAIREKCCCVALLDFWTNIFAQLILCRRRFNKYFHPRKMLKASML